MIGYLSGIILESDLHSTIINVNGVGYEVAIPLSTFDMLPTIGNKCELFIQTIVREDAIALYGFATKNEKNLFNLLINVSGIGGKLALAVLSALPVENFVGAINSGNLAMLSKISGVGKRTAERLIVELKGKLDDFSVSLLPSNRVFDDALTALVQLGYKRDTTAKFLQDIALSCEEDYSVEELIKITLQKLLK